MLANIYFLQLKKSINKNPLTKTGKPCKPYLDWQEKWHNKLKKLDNGFIIFLPAMFTLDNIKMP